MTVSGCDHQRAAAGWRKNAVPALITFLLGDISLIVLWRALTQQGGDDKDTVGTTAGAIKQPTTSDEEPSYKPEPEEVWPVPAGGQLAATQPPEAPPSVRPFPLLAMAAGLAAAAAGAVKRRQQRRQQTLLPAPAQSRAAAKDVQVVPLSADTLIKAESSKDRPLSVVAAAVLAAPIEETSLATAALTAPGLQRRNEPAEPEPEAAVVSPTVPEVVPANAPSSVDRSKAEQLNAAAGARQAAATSRGHKGHASASREPESEYCTPREVFGALQDKYLPVWARLSLGLTDAMRLRCAAVAQAASALKAAVLSCSTVSDWSSARRVQRSLASAVAHAQRLGVQDQWLSAALPLKAQMESLLSEHRTQAWADFSRDLTSASRRYQRLLFGQKLAMESLEACVAKYSDPNGWTSTTVVLEGLRNIARVSCLARQCHVPESFTVAAQATARQLHNALQDMRGKARVFCRVRPVGANDEGAPAVTVPGPMSVRVGHGAEEVEFDVDAAFGSEATQEEVYNECKDLVRSAVDGYPVTVLCYGQTGAGKTYTMYGSAKVPGLAQLMVEGLFRQLEDLSAQSRNTSFSVYMSCVEFYNNELTDLLAAPRSRRGSKSSLGHGLREWNESTAAHSFLRGPRAGVATPPPQPARKANSADRESRPQLQVRGSTGAIAGLSEHLVGEPAEVMQRVGEATRRRHMAFTKLNSTSSRSHLLLFFRVHVVNHETGEQQSGLITLGDLGGSERVKKSEVTEEQLKEAIEINRSLTSLADVIESLAKNDPRLPVPYRNHRLTTVLQESLGGTAKTLVIVNVAPSLAHRHESTTALMFAQRVRSVQSNPRRKSSKSQASRERIGISRQTH